MHVQICKQEAKDAAEYVFFYKNKEIKRKMVDLPGRNMFDCTRLKYSKTRLARLPFRVKYVATHIWQALVHLSRGDFPLLTSVGEAVGPVVSSRWGMGLSCLRNAKIKTFCQQRIRQFPPPLFRKGCFGLMQPFSSMFTTLLGCKLLGLDPRGLLLYVA